MNQATIKPCCVAATSSPVGAPSGYCLRAKPAQIDAGNASAHDESTIVPV